MLLDEPFGALDAFTKINLQEELLKIWEKEKITTLLVTHDIEEAIFLGNRVIVMSVKPGVIKKVVPIKLTCDGDGNCSGVDVYEKEEVKPEYNI